VKYEALGGTIRAGKPGGQKKRSSRGAVRAGKTIGQKKRP